MLVIVTFKKSVVNKRLKVDYKNIKIIKRKEFNIFFNIMRSIMS